MEKLNKSLLPGEKSNQMKMMKAEDDIISVLLNFPEYANDIESFITPDDFVTDFKRKAYILLTEAIKRNPTVEPLLSISQDITEEEMGKLSSKVRESKSFTVNKTNVKELCENLKKEKSKLLLKEVKTFDDDTFKATLNKLKDKEK